MINEIILVISRYLPEAVEKSPHWAELKRNAKLGAAVDKLCKGTIDTSEFGKQVCRLVSEMRDSRHQ